MSRRTDKKKLKRMNESAVSQASVTVATVSTVKADDAATAAETTAPVSQPSAAYDLYIQYQGADYNAEELASQIKPLKELLQLLGYTLVTCEGYEADDILGTFAKACEKKRQRMCDCDR